jgi:methionyl-tRNA synthetase
MDALETIRRMVDTVNEQIEEGKPWQLARDNKTGALTELLDNVYWVLGCIGKNIAPFMPETAEKIKDQLKTLKPEPIFPRIED